MGVQFGGNCGNWVVMSPVLELGKTLRAGRFIRLSSETLGLAPKNAGFRGGNSVVRHVFSYDLPTVLLVLSRDHFLTFALHFLTGTSSKTCSGCHVRFGRSFQNLSKFRLVAGCLMHQHFIV